MENHLHSDSYVEGTTVWMPPWVKLGAVAAVSALAGGIAAAWFYRKTLAAMQRVEEPLPAMESRIPEEEPDEYC